MHREKLERNELPHPTDNESRIMETGDHFKVRTMKRQPEPKIRKLDKDSYVVLDTGEVKDFEHTENRAEGYANALQSLSRLRDLINTNITSANAGSCLHVTLTYRENMEDPARLYDDFRKFNQRLRRYCHRHGFPAYEYIAIMEPQGRGAWHCHLLLIFQAPPPFLPNADAADTWGHGFVKVEAIKSADNLGGYFAAYFCDMELTEAVAAFPVDALPGDRIREIETTDSQGRRRKKQIIKGQRLRLYPPGFRIYRCSRGIKRPTVRYASTGDMLDEFADAALTYEKTVKVSDEMGREINVINYRNYHKPKGGPSHAAGTDGPERGKANDC